MTMRIVAIREPGGPEVLESREAERPSPGPADVLIKVKAAGVNRPDVLQRMGLYPPPEGAPAHPGLEVAGVVEEVGSDAYGVAPGDEVCALLAGGGYAEYAVAPAAQCLPIPPGRDMIQAAGLPEATFTAWHNLIDHGRLAEGQTVLIHGGASGVGVMAIQIAKLRGARVLTTVGSAARAGRLKELGADRVIHYKSEDFAEIAKAEGGVDLILDMVGGDYVGRGLGVLRTEGRYVSIAFLNGPKAEINIAPIMTKRLVLTGSTLRARPVAVKAAIARALRKHVWPALAEGRVRPVVEKTFPLERAGEAHAAMERGGHVGKFVLTL